MWGCLHTPYVLLLPKVTCYFTVLLCIYSEANEKDQSNKHSNKGVLLSVLLCIWPQSYSIEPFRS